MYNRNNDAQRIFEILWLAKGLPNLKERELAPCLYEIKRLFDKLEKQYVLNDDGKKEDGKKEEVCFKPYEGDAGGDDVRI